MKKIDLHIHTVSTVSDYPFVFSLDSLIDYVKSQSLDAIAITNHNQFDRVQYDEIVSQLSIPVFPGIEIDIESGHLLVIAAQKDIDEFSNRCQHIQSLNNTNLSTISESQFLEIFPNYEKYILIPHYDKNPVLQLDRISALQHVIVCGEVGSEKKFISLKKKKNELVPVLFSDCRISNNQKDHTNRQTYVDVEEISLTSLKLALSDHNKVSLSPDEGTSLFQVLDNGLRISSGLTVVLGERSSGKTHTLDAIASVYDNPTYIKQFSLVSDDEEKTKRNFENLLRRRGDSVTQTFLEPLKQAVDDLQNVDLVADERKVDKYLQKLKKAAEEAERKDEYSKAVLFNETKFTVKDLSSLEELVEAVNTILRKNEYSEIINNHIPRKQLLELAIDLHRKLMDEYQRELKKEFVNEIITMVKEDLKIRSTKTSIPDINLYEIQLNKERVKQFSQIVRSARTERLIEKKSYHSFDVVATAGSFGGAKEIHDTTSIKSAFSSQFKKYDTPYEYLCELRKIGEIPSTEYYKFFVRVSYEVRNQYGTKASGGEQSEFNLLQKIDEALHSEILIMDEPESSFDNLFLKNDVNSLLKELSLSIPVVIATHNNTIGASIHPDYLIYTKKDVHPNSEIEYHLYSGYPSNETLIDLDGTEISRREIQLDCLEAGETAYSERRNMYEDTIY